MDGITKNDGVIVDFDVNTGEGAVEVPSEFRTFKFTLRCFHGAAWRMATQGAYPERGQRVEVLCSPTPDVLLSVRAAK